MREFTPWLGICHLRQLADDSPDTQPTLAAVWADSVESFEREMHVYTNSHGQQMTWAEQVMPTDEWLVKHPARKDGQRLAGKVNAKHLVVLGGFGVGTTGLGSDGKPDGEDDGYLHIEEIEGVAPLDMQFGVHPPKTVPDALYEPLFGQPDPSAAEVAQYGSAEAVPPLNTYAILDAAKVVNFVEMLEASGLEHRCLFKGEAAQEMRDVAPYVVRLKEDVDFTRNLFSKDPEQEVPWFMWDKEPGIYVRSRGSLEDMWKHFRKFTKVQDEGGKWFYFRFWESYPTAVYLEGLSYSPVRLQQWAEVSNGGCIDSLIFPLFMTTMRCITFAKEANLTASGPSVRFYISGIDLEHMRQARLEAWDYRRAKAITKQFPVAEEAKFSTYVELVRAVREDMIRLGLTDLNDVKCAASLSFGFGFKFYADSRVTKGNDLIWDETDRISDRLYAMLAIRDIFRNMLLGPAEGGGLAFDYLNRGNRLQDFEACLKLCEVSKTFSKFFARAAKLHTFLGLKQHLDLNATVFVSYYFGDNFHQDPRYSHLVEKLQNETDLIMLKKYLIQKARSQILIVTNAAVLVPS